MLDVEVEPEILQRFPGYVALVLVARGIGNGPCDADSEAWLAGAEAGLRSRGLAAAREHPHIAAWRSAFSAFGAKPSKYPSSAEALASRVIKGGELPRINLLVDLYNAVSVRHLIPVGGEDADRLEGLLRLVVEPGGEIVWRDDAGVTCHRWNWRQTERTRLTEATRNAFFVFDSLDSPDLEAAAGELEAELRRRWPSAQVSRVVCGA